MAVVESNIVTKGKLMYQKENEEGELVNKTKTLSNILPGAGNEALLAGLSAVAGLLDVTGLSVGKVQECTLANE